MGAGQLQHLALGDHPAGAREDAQRLQAAGLDHELEGAGEQEVAHQHGGGAAPDEVGGDLAAAQLAAVHHVVVQEGGGVDELDGGGELEPRVAAPAPPAGRPPR